MAGKRFRTRREYGNTKVWAITSALLMLVALALLAITGLLVFPLVGLSICTAGFLLSSWQDRQERMFYGLEGDQLLLKSGQGVERIGLDQVKDASLVDRRAARDILLQHLREMEEKGLIPAEREEFQRSFMRWCTVDIGLRSFTFGIGRDLLRPDGKDDLVLIRLRDGRSILLSPVYNQDLVGSLNKVVQRDQRKENRA